MRIKRQFEILRRGNKFLDNYFDMQTLISLHCAVHEQCMRNRIVQVAKEDAAPLNSTDKKIVPPSQS
jgi:hypothetical protein